MGLAIPGFIYASATGIPAILFVTYLAKHWAGKMADAGRAANMIDLSYLTAFTVGLLGGVHCGYVWGHSRGAYLWSASSATGTDKWHATVSAGLQPGKSF